MKTIQRLFRWLFRSEPKRPKPPVKETVGDVSAEKSQPAQPPPSTTFYQDDSPPGYKVRWHH